MTLPSIPNKTLFLYGSILVAIILIVWGYNYIMKHRPVKLPNQTDWGKDLTDSESSVVARVTTDLYADMKGFNGLGHENGIYKEMANLSDRLLVAVGNYYRDKYKESLVSWLSAESFFGPASEYSKIIISRLTSLGVQ